MTDIHPKTPETTLVPEGRDPKACEPWKFWGSCLWTFAAIVVWGLVQLVAGVGLFAWFDAGVDLSNAAVEAFASHALTVSVVGIAAAPAELAVIWLAIRFARCGFADYLALVWPSKRDLLIGIACIVLLLPLADLTSYLAGEPIVPEFVRNLYRTAREANIIWLLAIALVIAAPVTEELVFRGFLYRGLAASRVGVVGAIVISSAVWAIMHIQYSPFFIAHIFIIGLVFGWLRWRSGSTTLTVILHAMVNLSSLVQVAILIERGS